MNNKRRNPPGFLFCLSQGRSIHHSICLQCLYQLRQKCSTYKRFKDKKGDK
jgi:hypothetical protein